MISANNVTLRIGKKALFEDVNIKFTEGNCYGLIGANGAGKSTFLKILSGQLDSTSGDVVITPGQRLSFLQQDHFKYDEYSVLDTVIMGNKRLYDIMKEKGKDRPFHRIYNRKVPTSFQTRWVLFQVGSKMNFMTLPTGQAFFCVQFSRGRISRK